MELQQNLNLITRILKQTVGLQQICREDFILNIKGNKPIHPFLRFFKIRQYCAKPATCGLRNAAVKGRWDQSVS